jgi:protein-S-isoprenylcysteine O-methyltransferase Ste14
VDGRRLPGLGPRGEGWFGLQLILFVLIAAAGAPAPAWSGVVAMTAVTVGGLLMCCGGILAIRGLIDLRENLTPFPKPLEGARLVETGAYRYARHPIYGGLVLGAIGWGLIRASLPAVAAAFVLAVFFTLKSSREEAWLAEQFAGYASYQARTRRMIPWLY